MEQGNRQTSHLYYLSLKQQSYLKEWHILGHILSYNIRYVFIIAISKTIWNLLILLLINSFQSTLLICSRQNTEEFAITETLFHLLLHKKLSTNRSICTHSLKYTYNHNTQLKSHVNMAAGRHRSHTATYNETCSTILLQIMYYNIEHNT